MNSGLPITNFVSEMQEAMKKVGAKFTVEDGRIVIYFRALPENKVDWTLWQHANMGPDAPMDPDGWMVQERFDALLGAHSLEAVMQVR